jgi:hypothetical protein
MDRSRARFATSSWGGEPGRDASACACGAKLDVGGDMRQTGDAHCERGRGVDGEKHALGVGGVNVFTNGSSNRC